ncbi:MAG: phytanoyl-CoA dioxygenase family protein [Gammaproteobacteria bacterium]|nr:phytanoyl-CoA dioxygenase family protein [Gammaproteobacteria bacterium]
MIVDREAGTSFELTSAEARRYERDGFLVRKAAFDTAEIARLRQAAERAANLAQALSEGGSSYILDGKRFVDSGYVTIQFEHAASSEAIRVIEPVHQLDSRLEALIDDPRLVEPMRCLVGKENIALWTDKLNLKRPREGSGFGWHQDSPYWLHDCAHVDQLPNVLLAFDDATDANGCLRVIRGSHTRGCLPGRRDGTQLGGFYTDPGHFDESQQVSLEVPAGSLVFFSPHMVHGSLPNNSDQPRRAIILTYQPSGYPMLKSGEMRNVCQGLNQTKPEPTQPTSRHLSNKLS